MIVDSDPPELPPGAMSTSTRSRYSDLDPVLEHQPQHQLVVGGDRIAQIERPVTLVDAPPHEERRMGGHPAEMPATPVPALPVTDHLVCLVRIHEVPVAGVDVVPG